MLNVSLNHGLEARFVDGDNAIVQLLYFCFVLIHTDDVISCLGETRAGYESNISGSDDSKLHVFSFVLVRLR